MKKKTHHRPKSKKRQKRRETKKRRPFEGPTRSPVRDKPWLGFTAKLAVGAFLLGLIVVPLVVIQSYAPEGATGFFGSWIQEAERPIPAGNIASSLDSPDLEVRRRARASLRRFVEGDLTPATTLQLVQGTGASSDAAAELCLSSLIGRSSPSLLSPLGELLPRYESRARTVAIKLLTEIGSSESDDLILDLLLSRTGHEPHLLEAAGFLALDPGRFETQASKLAQMLKRSDLFGPACRVLRNSVELKVDLGKRSGLQELVHAGFQTVWSNLLAGQRESGRSWRTESPYRQTRINAYDAVQLMGYLRGGDIKNLVQAVLILKDPVLKVAAVDALLGLGETPSKDLLHEVAADPESRAYLYRTLRRRGRLKLFPAKFNTKESFAETDLVNWLGQRSAYLRLPDEIEHVERVPDEWRWPARTYEWHTFRFRWDDPPDPGLSRWLAGIAGPYTVLAEPELDGPDTGSQFKPFSALPPRGHVQFAADTVMTQR